MNINLIMVGGNLGKDPVLTHTPNGRACCRFSIAVTEKWKDRCGGMQEDTTWLTIVAWQKLAELCNEYLRKGSQAFVEGKIKTRSWEDKEGNKKYATEVIASKVQFLDNKKDNGNSDPGGY